MNCLIVKISSLGDILHTLPALSDARSVNPDLRFDWVVEENFAEVPKWHPAVDRVIPVATRRWRRQWSRAPGEILRLSRVLRERAYDRIIDAQGLLKSAIAAAVARGPRYGPDRRCAREPLAALSYQSRIALEPGAHAVARNRALFAAVFGYPLPGAAPDYGLVRDRFPAVNHGDSPALMFLMGTSWPTKLWPLLFWQRLADRASEAGYRVLLPWGNAQEHQRANELAADRVEVLPQLTLSELAALIDQAAGAVAVDSGLGHLTAALGTPCVSIYGATNPGRTGTLGQHQVHVAANFPCAPCLATHCSYRGPAPVTPACYATVPPETVWGKLMTLMEPQTTT